jgi:hypothetical protein
LTGCVVMAAGVELGVELEPPPQAGSEMLPSSVA